MGITTTLRTILITGLAAGLALLAKAPALATPGTEHPCFQKDYGQRIEACTEFLNMPGLSQHDRASAFAMRALTLSLMGQYTDAIKDYDRAIELNPNFAVALNNRAWANYRMGNVAAAWPDVQRSLELDPWSGHAHDTRAHLRQADGDFEGAFEDYQAAMRFGGARMVRLYQCGLQAHGHYNGPLNGIVTEPLLAALKVCSSSKTCDPLPPDEECKIATS